MTDAGRPSRQVTPVPEPDRQVMSRDDAARECLFRAVVSAREAGLRPGMTPRRRRRWVDPSASSAGPDRRDPQLLSAEVEQLVRQRGWGEDVLAATVMARWAVFAGPEVAAHVAPVSFEAGVLSVRAESTAWATQLSYMVPDLHARIDEAIGVGVVTSIRVQGPSAPSWKRGLRRAVGRGPRDTYG